jgi:hypothetical protein
VARRERPTLWRTVSVLGVILAIGLFVLSSRYKGEPTDPVLLDSAVERLIPADGAPAALRQSEIGIDLQLGWTAVFSINGVRIPEDEYRRNEPENQYFFTPGKGKIIEELAPGDVVVSAIIWRPIDGQTETAGSRTVTWRFKVA